MPFFRLGSNNTTARTKTQTQLESIYCTSSPSGSYSWRNFKSRATSQTCSPTSLPDSPTASPTDLSALHLQLFIATKQGQCDVIEHLFQNGANPNCFEPDSLDTPLMIACRMGYSSIVSMCLRYGAKNDPHPNFGQTALHAAVEANQFEAAAILLNTASLSKANVTIVNLCDSEGYPPLHVSAFHNNSSMVELLVRHGANIFAVDSCSGSSAAHVAAIKGCHKSLSVLLDRGGVVLVDMVNNVGNTALHMATMFGNIKCIRCLLKRGANFLLQNDEGKTASDIAELSNIAELKDIFGLNLQFSIVTDNCVDHIIPDDFAVNSNISVVVLESITSIDIASQNLDVPIEIDINDKTISMDQCSDLTSFSTNLDTSRSMQQEFESHTKSEMNGTIVSPRSDHLEMHVLQTAICTNEDLQNYAVSCSPPFAYCTSVRKNPTAPDSMNSRIQDDSRDHKGSNLVTGSHLPNSKFKTQSTVFLEIPTLPWTTDIRQLQLLDVQNNISPACTWDVKPKRRFSMDSIAYSTSQLSKSRQSGMMLSPLFNEISAAISFLEVSEIAQTDEKLMNIDSTPVSKSTTLTNLNKHAVVTTGNPQSLPYSQRLGTRPLTIDTDSLGSFQCDAGYSSTRLPTNNTVLTDSSKASTVVWSTTRPSRNTVQILRVRRFSDAASPREILSVDL